MNAVIDAEDVGIIAKAAIWGALFVGGRLDVEQALDDTEEEDLAIALILAVVLFLVAAFFIASAAIHYPPGKDSGPEYPNRYTTVNDIVMALSIASVALAAGIALLVFFL